LGGHFIYHLFRRNASTCLLSANAVKSIFVGGLLRMRASAGKERETNPSS
jgi:hypothetical protein